jgi:hypothetical protein
VLHTRLTRGSGLWSVAFLVVISVAFTWPLGDLRRPQLPMHDDPLFSVWRLAWIAHQLPRNPARLFDANIFWPESNTLAFSDAMLLLGLLAAPLIWLGAHPVIVHNLLLIASFVSGGYAMMRLLRYFNLSRAAQLVGGVVFAFAPFRVAHIGHLELLWTAFLPLTLECLHRMLETPSIRRGVLLGVTLTLQGFSSIYYFVFLVIWLIPATLLAPLHVRVLWTRRHVVAAASAGLTAAVLLAPYAYVYSKARHEVGVRPEHDIQRFSAVPLDYLNVPDANRVYDARPTDSADERTLFVGALALALATLSVVRRRTPAAIPFAILALVAFDLSLGVNGVAYSALRAAAPALDSFRAPARFGVFVLLAIAALAGFAVHDVIGGIARRPVRLGATALLIAGMFVEYWSAPLPAVAHPMRAPAIYQWLATQPRTVAIEMPLPESDALWLHETTYQYFSIYHWQPLLNGYSGYAPPSYVRVLEAMREFPAEGTLQYLANGRVDLVLLHERFMAHGDFDRLLTICSDQAWFSEVRVFDDPVLRRSAACRLAPRPLLGAKSDDGIGAGSPQRGRHARDNGEDEHHARRQ